MQHTKFRENWPAGSGEEDYKGLYHIWGWRPSWSCDPDAANKLSFPLPKGAPHKIWLFLAQRFRRRLLKMADERTEGRTTDGQTDAGTLVSYKLSLKAFGSDELICPFRAQIKKCHHFKAHASRKHVRGTNTPLHPTFL